MKAPRPDPAPSDDGAAWDRFAASVRPLRPLPDRSPAGRTQPSVPLPPRPGSHPAPHSVPPAVPPVHLAPLTIGVAPAGLDRASWRRLSSGRLRPARRLDLHGLTAAAALAALESFLAASAADGERTVEVITGRGAGAEGGVIRRELSHWLNRPSLRPLLLGACHPHPANPGAVILLLRRRR